MKITASRLTALRELDRVLAHLPYSNLTTDTVVLEHVTSISGTNIRRDPFMDVRVRIKGQARMYNHLVPVEAVLMLVREARRYVPQSANVLLDNAHYTFSYNAGADMYATQDYANTFPHTIAQLLLKYAY